MRSALRGLPHPHFPLSIPDESFPFGQDTLKHFLSIEIDRGALLHKWRIVLWHRLLSEIQRFATVLWQCVTIRKQLVRSDQVGFRGDGEDHAFSCDLLWRVMLFFCLSKGKGQNFRKDNTLKRPSPPLLSPIKNVSFPYQRRRHAKFSKRVWNE